MTSPVHRSSGIPFNHVPAYLPGSASLVEELDQRLLVVLRDGKHLIGTLVSYDQYSNMVLSDTVERQIVVKPHGDNNSGMYYHDMPLGMYIVRGDSVVLTGQVGEDTGTAVSLEKLQELQQQEGLQWDFDNDLIA